jgi:predicted DNA-binding protein (MmcQ/YjbR family)
MTETEDERLKRLTEICLAWPGTEREMLGAHAGFKVKKKTFAYFLSDHHGDGIVGVTCKVLPGENAALILARPKRFYMPAYVGPRGWVGLRLDVGRVSWKEVGELVGMSYSLVVGKKRPGMEKSQGLKPQE